MRQVRYRSTKKSIKNSVNFSATAAQDITKFIRIVDNIAKNYSKPRNSVTIKREISKISSEKVNIKHTYTLPRGGVALHFKA